MITRRIGPTSLLALGLFIASIPAAHAVDGTEGLDPCLEAVLKQREGMIIGWEGLKSGPAAFKIVVMTKDGRVWDTTCDVQTLALTPFSQSLLRELRNYKMLTERAKVTEDQARFTVKTYYAGKFEAMKYGTTSFRGGAAYVYTVITPDDREATVEVDAATARILQTKSKARE